MKESTFLFIGGSQHGRRLPVPDGRRVVKFAPHDVSDVLADSAEVSKVTVEVETYVMQFEPAIAKPDGSGFDTFFALAEIPRPRILGMIIELVDTRGARLSDIAEVVKLLRKEVDSFVNGHGRLARLDTEVKALERLCGKE